MTARQTYVEGLVTYAQDDRLNQSSPIDHMLLILGDQTATTY